MIKSVALDIELESHWFYLIAAENLAHSFLHFLFQVVFVNIKLFPLKIFRSSSTYCDTATKLQPSTAVRRTGLLLCSFVFYEIYIQSTLIARPTILSTSVVHCPSTSSGLFQLNFLRILKMVQWNFEIRKRKSISLQHVSRGRKISRIVIC